MIIKQKHTHTANDFKFGLLSSQQNVILIRLGKRSDLNGKIILPLIIFTFALTLITSVRDGGL